MVGRSTAGRGSVGRGRGNKIVGSPGICSGLISSAGSPGIGNGDVGNGRGVVGCPGKGEGMISFPSRGSGVGGSLGRGRGGIASPGRGSGVGACPGRGSSIGASPGRSSGVGASPGRGSGVVGSPGRGNRVVGSPGRGSGVVGSPGQGRRVLTPTSSSVQGDDMVDFENYDSYHDEGLDGLNMNDEEISQGGRGSNDQPFKPSLRKWLFVTEDGHHFFDDGTAAREITEILKNMYNGVWPTWGKVPEVEKDRLYEQFKKFYQWDPYLETYVKGIWKGHNRKKLTEHMNQARKAAIEKAISLGMDVENDLSPIIPFNPTWIKQEFWSKLVLEHWNLDKWKAISLANKANRAQFTEGYHTTGSVGYVVARRRFEEKMGGPQPSVEFFSFSHSTKGTTTSEGSTTERVFIDDRARITAERYKEYMLEKFGPNLEDHPQHDQECWERAVGKRKKGSSYGSGKSKDPQFVLTGKPSSLSSNNGISFVGSQAEAQIQRINRTMEEMKEQHEREKREMLEQHKTQIRESQEQLKKEINDNMAEMMRAELQKMLPNYSQPPP